MKFRPLADTGVFVSELCLGTMTFGGTGEIWQAIGGLDQAAAGGIVHRALTQASTSSTPPTCTPRASRRRWSERRSRGDGRTSCSQLDDNLKAIDVTLTVEDLKSLDEVSKLAPEYPAWMDALGSDRRPGERRY